MWSPRAQCDRGKFIWAWREVLENTPNLHIWQDQVKELVVEGNTVKGVKTYFDLFIKARCVVLTAGTFLNGIDAYRTNANTGGKVAEPPSYHLTESLTRHGITTGRMKTGTPYALTDGAYILKT